MAKKELTVEQLKAKVAKLEKSLAGHKLHAKQLRETIKTLNAAPTGRARVYGGPL